MQYKTGIFGGSMDPPHLGHLRGILRAASSCERLYVILSYSRLRDSVPMEYRYRWLRAMTKHLPNVTIVPQEDTAPTKEDFAASGGWERTTEEICALLGGEPEAVFCGSDYRGTGRYEALYPHAEIHYLERSETDISSSQIRQAPLRYWELLPEAVRPYYVKTVLIVGSESTGKSTLAKNLALYFQTQCVEEAGREICDQAGGEDTMVAEDLHRCLLYQKTALWEQKQRANRVLFVDTDALTTAFYIGLLLPEGAERDRAEGLAQAVADTDRFDLVLFLEPTVAFVQDGTRNEAIADHRDTYSQQLRQQFDRRGIPYYRLDGDYRHRLEAAVRLTEEMLRNG